jgi:hypothetical protein
MKLIKKITAAFTAMALAASMMSIGASAWEYSSWAVHYYSYAPTSSNIYTVTSDFYYQGSPITQYMDHCTTFNSNVSGPRVAYWGDVYNVSNQKCGNAFSKKYYYGTYTLNLVELMSPGIIYPGYFLRVTHHLENADTNIWASGQTQVNT